MYRPAVVIASALLLVLCSVPVCAETYIVPIWASGLPASDGYWWAKAVLINPHPVEVTFRVTRVFSLATEFCPACLGGANALVSIPAFGFSILEPRSQQPGERLVAGAVEIQSSAGLALNLVAYRPGPSEIRQRLDAVPSWLDSGTYTVSSVEFSLSPQRMNAFIINPTARTIDVSLWVLDRAENELHVSIPPESMKVVRLPQPVCDGMPCSFPDQFPPYPFQVHVQSSGQFLVTVSSIGDSWAIFAPPDVTAIR